MDNIGASVTGLDGFGRQQLSVNGVRTVVYTAGAGIPLVFLHGAGTFHGFPFAASWAERFRVIVPYHPGFGESDDEPRFNAIQDYVVHYLDLFDALGLEQVNLVGFSLGGWLAAEFAVLERQRLCRLVLVAPAGLRVPEHPPTDLFTLPPQELPAYLVHDLNVILPHLPKQHDVEFLTARYRESSTLARLIWDGPSGSRKLHHWLHRVTTPTLLVWGRNDRILPVEQAASWQNLLPNATLRIVGDAGHLVLDEKPEAVEAITQFLTQP